MSIKADSWIGGIGDRRVVCLNTMRVYMSPESAAYSLNFSRPNVKGSAVKAQDISTNCNRFVRTIISGEKFEWYNQYLLDTGKKDFHILPDPIILPAINSNRILALRNNQGPKNFYEDVRKIYRAVKKTYLDHPEIIGMSFSIPRFLELIGIDRKSSAAFSRHFKLHQKTYEHLFQAEFSTMYSPVSRKDILSIKLNSFRNIGNNKDVDKDWDIIQYFSKHHDRESLYLKGKSNVSKPVIRLEDYSIFGSLATASRMTAIERTKISWCCYGDIPYCKKWASKNTFRFVKFEEST